MVLFIISVDGVIVFMANGERDTACFFCRGSVAHSYGMVGGESVGMKRCFVNVDVKGHRARRGTFLQVFDCVSSSIHTQ